MERSPNHRLPLTAVGGQAIASGIGAQTFGWQATASGTRSTAIGRQAQATATEATAVGDNARATAANATALGRGAVAAFAGSTAVGSGAVTTAANQVTLGATGSSVRVGDIVASTAAQRHDHVATVDPNGTLGRNTTLLPPSPAADHRRPHGTASPHCRQRDDAPRQCDHAVQRSARYRRDYPQGQ